jgi:tRNA threonylcarbamoyl adenosine modification protein YeaZ
VNHSTGLLVAIDTTSDVAGIALLEGERLISEMTWYSREAHSRTLLPNLELLLGSAGRTKDEISAIAVSLGPGSYAGMRVGVSTAKALAFGLDASLVGVGRLEADAYPFLGTAERVIAIHAAGRADLASASYTEDGRGGLREISEPQLRPAAELLPLLHAEDLICGDLEAMRSDLLDAFRSREVRLVQTHPSRAVAVGRLGLKKLEAGLGDDPDSLTPLYLRAPAIGPQPPR